MSAIVPRPVQLEALEALQHTRDQGIKRALIEMASGLGKTVVAALDIQRFMKQHSGRVLVLCHQNHILAHAQRELTSILGEGVSYGFFTGLEKTRKPVDCLFASFQTMGRHLETFDPGTFAYVVVDESHHTHAETYLPTVLRFKPKFLLGLTATPDRMDLQDIREIYGPEVYSKPLPDALAERLLARVDYRMITDELRHRRILDTPIGRLSISQLNRTIFVRRRDEEIVQITREKVAEVSEPRVIIFCPSVRYTGRLLRLLPDAVAVHSGIHEDVRERSLEGFNLGEVRYLLAVDVLNEGVDMPEANVVVFLRSTASHTVFYQQLGRGLRKTGEHDTVLVLDFVGNCERIEMVRDLQREVGEAQARAGAGRPPEDTVLDVDMGGFIFDEAAVDILDVLDRVRRLHAVVSSQWTWTGALSTKGPPDRR